MDVSARSSGSDGRHVARSRHSRRPASSVPPSGHSPLGVSPSLALALALGNSQFTPPSVSVTSSERPASAVGAHPSLVLTTSRRRRSSVRTASVVVVAPICPYRPPNPVTLEVHRAFGHPPLSHAGVWV